MRFARLRQHPDIHHPLFSAFRAAVKSLRRTLGHRHWAPPWRGHFSFFHLSPVKPRALYQSAGRRAVLVLLFPAALFSAPITANSQDNTTDEKSKSTPGDIEWLTHGGTYAEQRFSPADQINIDNVNRLGLSWYFEFDTARGQEATPLVVNGIIYTTSAWSKVYALDARSGKLIWSYDPEVPGSAAVKGCCDVVNRGAAYADGRVFVGTFDGRLMALDAESGDVLWSTLTVDPAKPYTITGAPRVAKGKVYIGNGGAEYGVRGYISAYEASNGALAWRFYTVPGNPADGPDGAASDSVMASMARETWHGDKYWQYGGGGTVWDSIVYDAELDQLYFGVGNGSPWNHRERSAGKGDNLFLSSIVAVNPDSGEYLWHYQEIPAETWDYTATQQITLASLEVEGQQRDVLLHAPKNGFFYVVDRHSGKLISAEKFAPVNWASHIDPESGRPVETENARFEKEPWLATIGASGAHNWQPMSFSPETGLVYIPAQQVPFLYMEEKKFIYRPGSWNLGVDMMSVPPPETREEKAAAKAALKGWLLAWDPVKQQEVWRAQHETAWNGGTLATAGGLVFQGTTTNSFNAYNAADGEALWQFNAGLPIQPGPVSYTLDGEQYVAVMSGNGGGFPLTLPAIDGPRKFPNGRLLVFKLGGNTQLPSFDDRIASLNPPDESAPTENVKKGKNLFGLHCAQCHGVGTMSAGVLPDLKRSAALTSESAWRAIVAEGVLEARGMGAFSHAMTDEEIDMVRDYVGYRAQVASRHAQEAPASGPAKTSEAD